MTTTNATSTDRDAAREARHKVLRDWLDKHDAVCMWEQKVPRVGTLTCYRINGRILLAQTYTRGNGWELYLPVSGSNRVDATLEAAEVALGLRDAKRPDAPVDKQDPAESEPLTSTMQQVLHDAAQDPKGQYDAGSGAAAGGRMAAARGLVQRGLLREIGRCFWEITDAGRAALARLNPS